jgi:hypothetical protein
MKHYKYNLLKHRNKNTNLSRVIINDILSNHKTKCKVFNIISKGVKQNAA